MDENGIRIDNFLNVRDRFLRSSLRREENSKFAALLLESAGERSWG